MTEPADERGTEATSAPSASSRSGRDFGLVLAVGLATSGLGTIAANQTWATAAISSPGRREVAVAGSDVAPVVFPFALVALACWSAFVVLRSKGRRLVAALGALAAGGAVVAVLTSVGGAGDAASALLSDAAGAEVSGTAWPWVGAVSLAVSVIVFVVAALRCGSWPEMSRRYDRDTEDAGAVPNAVARAEKTPADQWRALDDGRDPTV